MKKSSKEILFERFDYLTERSSLDHEAINVPQDKLLEVVKYIKSGLQFDMLIDISGLDAGVDKLNRFSVVYHFFTTLTYSYIRIVTECADNLRPSVPSLVSLWPAADWHEREAYDMFGIEFKGHPDLKRILMWDGYEYFPLRKDFPLAGMEGDLPGKDVAEETGTRVIPSPMEGGPFCAQQAFTMKYREPKGLDQAGSDKSNKPLPR